MLSGKIGLHSFRVFLTLAFLCTFSQEIWSLSDECEGVSDITEGLDSLSYAYGDVIIRSIVENSDSIYPGFRHNKENYVELIRGIEENLAYMKYSQDTIKNISFRLGAMQGVFISDGFQSQRDIIPYDCIISGLMKVVNHELTLPQDTIKIHEFMKGLPENMKLEDMSSEDRCLVFTYLGIMKGLQPGLQDYIHEMTGKSKDEAPADYEAYIAGFAMIVKLMSLDMNQEPEQSPYDIGVSIGSSIIMKPLSFHFKKADFLEGCRAAAGLNERKITVEESDWILSLVFPNSEEPIIIQENNPN